MAAQDYNGVVEQLYVSYFGRPADYYGLQNFTAQLNAIGAPTTFDGVQAAVQADKAGTSPLSQLVNSFNNSPESVALYGNDNTQIGISKFVAAIYQNVLGREADTAGFNFWVNAITSGSLTKANAAAAITQGALTNTSAQGLMDAKTVQNKLAVATSFTTAIDTPTEINAFSGDAAAAAARSLVKGVTNTTDLTAYQTNINSTIADLVNKVVPSTTTSLTAGVDTLTGTAGNDVFNALSVTAAGADGATLSNFDSIDGSAGNDTLNIYTNGAINASLGTNTSIKGVETVNIYNAAAAATGLTDASKYAGVTALWQIGAAADVTNLGSTTAAGFRSSTNTTFNVTAADAAASATVALDGAKEGSVLNVMTNAGAGALAAVTVAGTVNDTNGDKTTANTALNVTVGKDVQSLSVNTAVATILTVNNGGGTKAVNTVNAGASTGKIAYTTVGTAVTNVTTGSGNDTVTAEFTTVAAAGTTAATNASLMTGAGNDTIVVTAAAASTGLTTIDAGAGNDKITITKLAGAGLNVMGGDGDDTVTLNGTALATSDVINGGAGTDTISLAGAATRSSGDYIIFNKLLTGFESVKFTGATAEGALDASQLGANFTSIELNSGAVVTKVGAQSITANGAVTVSASGYTAADGATKAVYAGTLNITEKATGNVTANADIVKLTVNASSTADVTATLLGDAKSAIVTLTNAVDSGSTVDHKAAFALDTSESDSGLTSVTLSGNGSAMITNAGGALVNVDASALGGTYTVAATATQGLTYESSNTANETIKLGSGIDHITLTGSHYGAVDTITGLNLAVTGTTPALTATSDTLSIGAAGFVKFTTTQTDLDLALTDAAAKSDNTLVFTLGGDTYVYQDAGTLNSVDAGDVVVKLTGTINLDALILTLNTVA